MGNRRYFILELLSDLTTTFPLSLPDASSSDNFSATGAESCAEEEARLDEEALAPSEEVVDFFLRAAVLRALGADFAGAAFALLALICFFSKKLRMLSVQLTTFFVCSFV